MLNSDEDQREQQLLLDLWKERAAVQCWTLITMLELNEGEFDQTSELYADVVVSLEEGFDMGEKNNYRWACNIYHAVVQKILAEQPDLIMRHQKLVDALLRAREIREKTTPLFEKHQDAMFPPRE